MFGMGRRAWRGGEGRRGRGIGGMQIALPTDRRRRFVSYRKDESISASSMPQGPI